MVAFLPPAVAALLLFTSSGTPNSNGPSNSPPSQDEQRSAAPELTAAQKIADLIESARARIAARDPDGAFANLADAYGIDPTAGGLQSLFESCLLLRIDVAEEGAKASKAGDNGNSEAGPRPSAAALVQDRFGLASLLIDQERYEEAGVQLRAVVASLPPGDPILDKASAMLYRTNAACCHWDEYDEDGAAVAASLNRFSGQSDVVPALHPFEALKFPCVTLERATEVAATYARRAEVAAGVEVTPPGAAGGIGLDGDEDEDGGMGRPKIVSVRTDAILQQENDDDTIIRVGYLSPDFTSTHPLAFLMQHVFRCHDRDKFRVFVYSLSRDDGSPEVEAVKDGSDAFTVLPPGTRAREMADRIKEDNLDVMIDLCGYAGSSVVAELMALRQCAPVQVSYMGFPGSSGASYMDYMVVDPTVVPPSVDKIRRQYTERLILMPDCYFVNSHRTCAREFLLSDAERKEKRLQYGLPKDGFVYCCHSRPDKIDPSTFRTWLRALVRVREKHDSSAVLWLLRSGQEMERNLCAIARTEFRLDDSALVFCDIAPREEHLRRLACADLFLDTPAYGAHTVGCDSLFASVPMVSLLRQDDDAHGTTTMVSGLVQTEKLASRVGASLLKAAGLDEFVCRDMGAYERLMVKCAEADDWYSEVKGRLRDMRDECPLFDTDRWVNNLELALRQIVLAELSGTSLRTRRDIIVLDNT